MTSSLQHTLEIGAGTATLYLAGTLTGSDAFALRRVCREIPLSVATLRLDLQSVTRHGDGAMDAIRALVRFWRDTRRGGFRVSFASEHLVATCVDAGSASTDRVIDRIGGRKAALTGMFL